MNGLSSATIQAMVDDADGNLWVGTSAGLNRYRDGKFTAVRDEKTAVGEDITALLLDADGTLWIGTRGWGLGRLRQGKWTHYTTEDGLASDSIGYLVEDNQTNLWMGSPAGFMRISKKALNDFAANPTNTIVCRVYGVADGLPTGECTFGSQPAACRTRDGKLWFPSINGLVVVDPAKLKPNTNLPPVRIQAVSVEGRMVVTNTIQPRLPAAITIPPRKERLDIQFTSPDLLAGGRVRFKYRMEEEGHDSGWTEVDGSTRTAHYSRLQPGEYNFHVIACNEDGLWNETGASLAIIVKPPFWKTWSFIIVASLCVVGIIVGSVHYFSTQRLQRQLALEKERRRIARDIHDQVGASLTQVSMLGEMVESDKDSPADVEEHGKQISQTARDTAKALDEIVWAVNPSNDTLDGLITYFCKNAQEYLTVAGLKYRLDVPSQLPATPMAPDVRHNVFLAAKEAVTNVVRHAKATSVWLRLRLEPSQFILEIEDNGKGMAGMDPQHAATRNGLSNMRKRLEESGGTCAFSPGAEGGTLVRLTVPLGKRQV
jgi:signal transduction histidine kinase/streptogramin lyase